MTENRAEERLKKALNEGAKTPFGFEERSERQLCRLLKEEETYVKKKVSFALALAVVMTAVSLGGLAAALLWKDAGEKAAPMEKQNGYYDTWTADAKMELVNTLWDMGALKDVPEARDWGKGEPESEEDKSALCDRVMTAYLGGGADTVTLDALLEKLHGPMDTWPQEDLAWYRDLLERNSLNTAEDMHYTLSEGKEMTQAEAMENAKKAFAAMGESVPENAKITATMYADDEDAWYGKTQVSFKGRRLWSVLLESDKGVWHIDFTPTGEMTNYSTPALQKLCVTGLPEEGAALTKEAALKAAGMEGRAVYGYVNINDEKAAGAPLGDKVWCVLWENGHALLDENGQKLR